MKVEKVAKNGEKVQNCYPLSPRRHEPPDFMEHIIIQNDFGFLVVSDVLKIIHMRALLV